MRLSDIFRRAAERVSSDKYASLCLQLNREFRQVEEGRKRTPEETREFRRLYRKAKQIMSQFKPKYARSDQFWFTVTNEDIWIGVAKNAYVCESVEAVQAKRKEILLKCAEIAESEGL